MNETNLTKIKEVAKLLFDVVEIKEHKDFSYLVQHPFASNTLVGVPMKAKNVTKLVTEYKRAVWKLIHDNEKKRFNMSRGLDTHYRGLLKLIESNMVDITIPEGKEIFRTEIFNFIDSSKLLVDILMLINKPWYMTFLKYTEVYMSNKDLGSILGQCWVEEEYPNRDTNASLREIINLFKRADKIQLMNEDDYRTYKHILSNCNGIVKTDGTLTVYRGVSNNGKPEGLSWTTDIEVARRFASRWNLSNQRIYKLDINLITDADKVLACFTTRGEQEVVVNTLAKSIRGKWEVIS